MVLPTLSSYNDLKRVNFNQEFLRSKQLTSYDQQQKWSNASKYYNHSNTFAAQHSQWTSEKSFNDSMNAYSKIMDNSAAIKEQKAIKLKDRQLKLQELFREESNNFEKEMKDLRINGINNSKTLDSLKYKIDTIKSAREEDRKRLAEEKMYQHWRENNPDIREIESKQLTEFVSNQWNDQVKEKQAAVKLLEEENSEYARYLEAEKQKAEDLDLELKQLKMNREIELKEILKQQMIELKQREAESEILGREEADLMTENYEVMRLNEQRKILNEQNSKQEYGNYLLRQHKAKLRQRAREVQDQLLLDLEILERISENQEKQKHLNIEKKLKAKEEAENMIMVLNQQMRLEKQREAELETMFQDEAAKEWEKRNAEWERERVARENLMKQVLEERKLQMDDKLRIINEKKIETLEKREELIKDMEKTQRLAIIEKQKAEQQKRERKLDIESQISARKENVFAQNILKNVDDYEKEQIKNDQIDLFLNKEKEKQVQTKFEPKTFARRKVVWN